MMKTDQHRQKGFIFAPLVFGIAGAWVGGAIGAALGSAVIGAAIGYTVGSMVGAYLFPTKTKMSSPKVGSYPIQTCNTGGAVPIVYGKRKVAGNIIWLGDLHPYKHRVA